MCAAPSSTTCALCAARLPVCAKSTFASRSPKLALSLMQDDVTPIVPLCAMGVLLPARPVGPCEPCWPFRGLRGDAQTLIPGLAPPDWGRLGRRYPSEHNSRVRRGPPGPRDWEIVVK